MPSEAASTASSAGGPPAPKHRLSSFPLPDFWRRPCFSVGETLVALPEWPPLMHRKTRAPAAPSEARSTKDGGMSIACKAVPDKRRAQAFEAYLKSGSGHAFAKKRLW